MKYAYRYVCDRCGDEIPKGSLICTLIFGYKKYGKRKRHYCYSCSCEIAEAIDREESRK